MNNGTTQDIVLIQVNRESLEALCKEIINMKLSDDERKEFLRNAEYMNKAEALWEYMQEEGLDKPFGSFGSFLAFFMIYARSQSWKLSL